MLLFGLRSGRRWPVWHSATALLPARFAAAFAFGSRAIDASGVIVLKDSETAL
jgi:hypothetical protein